MKLHVSRTLALTALLLVVGFSVCSAREWMSADGKYKVKAELVESDGTAVHLQVENGSLITVPLDKLSEADQKFVTEKLGKPASPPVKTMSQEEIEAALAEIGMEVGSISLSHDDESQLRPLFSDLEKSRRSLFRATKQLNTVEQQLLNLKQSIVRLEQINVQLNARLTTINPTDFAENNRLVGAINANNAQGRLFMKQQQHIEEGLRKTRAETNKVRESYIEDILALRKAADEIQAKFAALAKEPRAQKLVAQLNQLTGKEYGFDSRTFDTSLEKLKEVEDTVLSESIKLRRDPGGTHYVSVVIDGDHTYEMVLDSGASLISLPERIARESGIEIDSKAPDIVLELADGSRIPGKLVTIPKVRVGKFTVENVEAAVLGPQAIRAEPLLGMSFLEQFKFEIDAQDNTLTMVKVEPE